MTSVNATQEALVDALRKDDTDPQDMLGEHGFLKRLTKRVVERVLEAELPAHLGDAPHVRHGTEARHLRARSREAPCGQRGDPPDDSHG